MDNLDLARWQFAITTVYHFLFVPITIGLSAIVAGYHTAWVRTRKPEYLRLTKWLGKLFTINFALGLVTGIVQEFQFGMNWSDYSRFVGDIFGAPLAFEALLAFFLESTFLGLWIFGWGRIPERLHAWTMWIVHIGTVLSAYFILAANSFMQHPVGFRFNPQSGRAEMADFIAVLTNKVQLVTFPHVITASYMTGGAVVVGVALWHYLRRGRIADRDREMYRKAVRVGAIVSLVASLGVIVTGDLQGKVMTDVQPMKMAAAEGLYHTEKPAGFSPFTIGSLDGSREVYSIKIPGLLSFLGTGSFDGEVKGIRDIQADYQQKYAANRLTADPATNYVPNIPTTYWTFRLMIGVGFLSMLLSALALWATRKGGTPPTARWWKHVVIWSPLLPVVAVSFGWIFTEVGRQPWIVFGQMSTATGVSPSVPAWSVLVSMVVYTLLYAALAVVEVKLFLKYTRVGAEPADTESPADAGEDKPLVFAY
ncbi:cytochrome ubiquinol oxidase subunit I [Arsenicicoccus sp. oral taxon 190]|uniref:cytochrome ubiquinol oxidase subunit I n=1 Tax=Arsenicicoccus sp. oral taxon 190 TaxID=1658671 RepID=UPI00067A3927|nr:cytochrome ubiquinol oxidase subunit I [Arsenicicoccus sp. oral taxon 190]AKT50600.1 cytochrome BD ubiquinol oxidase subunit I [Arsenicicoccus sp. oral taxon 190]